MTTKENKKLISLRLHPDLLKDIEDICNKTTIVSRTELIEQACQVFIEENQ
jgi:metal-responsive CopG/Arc/MetJ family transcriptional regulator